MRLLDSSLQVLDLSSADLTDADYGPISQVCKDLRVLTLGGTSDAVLKQLLVPNSRLEQVRASNWLFFYLLKSSITNIAKSTTFS